MTNHLETTEPQSCACQQCKFMCKTSPCIPTPEEVVKLFQHGYGDRIKPTVWLNIKNGDQYTFMAPLAKTNAVVIKGHVIPLSQCTFLDKDDNCELHDKGLKPIEGRLAMHGQSETYPDEIRTELGELWKNSYLGKMMLDAIG